jgi:hypothetical protein
MDLCASVSIDVDLVQINTKRAQINHSAGVCVGVIGDADCK